MSPERRQVDLNKEALALLEKIAEKAPVLWAWEKISLFPGGMRDSPKSTGDYGSYESSSYALFLTKNGLVEKHTVSEYISEADGFPFNEDVSEYPVGSSSYHIVQRYLPDEDDLKTMETLLNELKARAK